MPTENPELCLNFLPSPQPPFKSTGKGGKKPYGLRCLCKSLADMKPYRNKDLKEKSCRDIRDYKLKRNRFSR